jgi:hypothetical protein
MVLTTTTWLLSLRESEEASNRFPSRDTWTQHLPAKVFWSNHGLGGKERCWKKFRISGDFPEAQCGSPIVAGAPKEDCFTMSRIRNGYTLVAVCEVKKGDLWSQI